MVRRRMNFASVLINYEANKHYFLAQYFRENYNKHLSRPPVLATGINITKIEVWITNKSGATAGFKGCFGFIGFGGASAL